MTGRPGSFHSAEVTWHELCSSDILKITTICWERTIHCDICVYLWVCVVVQMERLVARSTDSAGELKTTADKYCCVFLPDGTASLTPARPGITIRHMLTGLCEKRGLPLSDIIIYLQGKDKVGPFYSSSSGATFFQSFDCLFVLLTSYLANMI